MLAAPRCCCAFFFVAVSGVASGATTRALPAWVCNSPDTIFRTAHEGVDYVPHDASGGSGGAAPGNVVRSVTVVGLGFGVHNYYVHVPPDYTPTRPWPLIVLLHGTAPNSATPPNADSYAQATRDSWVTASDAGHFLVAAPVADDVQPGYVSWLVPPHAGPTDYDLIGAVLADMQVAYNIERTRRYGWGFSSGGHVMYDLAINNAGGPGLNPDNLAGFGISAGALAGLACAGLTDTQCNQAIDAMPRRIPFDIHVGHSDNPTHTYALADRDRFVARGWTLGTEFYYTAFTDGSPAGGHTYTTAHLNAIWSHLCPWAVTTP
jgi:poly(3-hydroxybutyrate) depolymerase